MRLQLLSAIMTTSAMVACANQVHMGDLAGTGGAGGGSGGGVSSDSGVSAGAGGQSGDDGGSVEDHAISCSRDGVTYPVGATFPAGDGCNTCSCSSSGQVICTRCACIAGDAGTG